MNKIAFIGSQGTGKTTQCYRLAYELKKLGNDVYVLSEVARSCPLPLNESATLSSQYWIFGKQLTREQSCKASILISDRSLLDPFIYGYNKYRKEFSFLIPFVHQYLKTYQHIIYLPKNDSYLTSDGIRSTNKQFRNSIDNLTKHFISFFNINLSTVESVLSSYQKKAKKSDKP